MGSSFDVLVFDLDDTLYLERDFALSGFRIAGDWMKATMGIETFAEKCAQAFVDKDRTRIFDTVLQDYGLADRIDILARLIEIYRCHVPSISLAPDAARFLGGRRDTLRALISDGLEATQAAKIKSLALEDFVDFIVLTDTWGREFWKPHERAFAAVEAWSGASPTRIVYIADNPVKDFVAPKRRGWQTVAIARPERMHRVDAPDWSYQPNATIESFDQLEGCLATLSGLIKTS